MLQERRNHILQKVTENGKVRVADLSRICPVKDVYKIITDSQISKEYIRKAEHEQIPLVIAGNREQAWRRRKKLTKFTSVVHPPKNT